jgi:Sperm-tail PG-rich repeat
MRKTSPAWSFRGRSLEGVSESLPGPGSYSPSHIESTPSFRIGTSKRLESNIKFSNPGPGKYNPEKSSAKAPNIM